LSAFSEPDPRQGLRRFSDRAVGDYGLTIKFCYLGFEIGNLGSGGLEFIDLAQAILADNRRACWADYWCNFSRFSGFFWFRRRGGLGTRLALLDIAA
jgi:hypothetical protein